MLFLLVCLVLAAVLLLQAARAPACIGNDGKLPPGGGSGANGIIVEQIQLAHALAKARGEETPTQPPISGTHPTVIILIQNAAAGAPFNPSFSAAALWSARLTVFDNYYNQVSRGILRISAAQETYGTANDGVIGPLTVSGLSSSTDVTLTAGSADPLAAAAIKAANPYINFAAYDKNNDGKIVATELHILIYQAGVESSFNNSLTAPPRAWAQTVWKSGGLSGLTPSTDSDGKTLTSYCYCGSEFQWSNGKTMATQGSMTHELGHDIGLPDLYDTDGAGSGGTSGGLGLNCLMASGEWGGTAGPGDSPTHLNPYHKNWLGWANQATVVAPVNQARTLAAANGSNQALRINVAGSQEFFMVENRQQTGFDVGLPETDGGVLIFHCDDALLNGAALANNRVNANPNNMGIKLEEADGLSQIAQLVNRGDDNDYYRLGNNAVFNTASNPNSNLKSGAASGVAVTNVSASAASMTFNVGAPAPAPVVTSFLINGGASSAASEVVTLNNTCTGSPTEYMASESSTFAGAAWKPYAVAPAFTLSAGNVVKTVYFKVRNAAGQASNVKYDTILLERILDLAVGPWYVEEITPLGDNDWFRFQVTTTGIYRIDTFPWTLTDNFMRLYGPNNRTTLIAEDDDSASGYMARISKTLNPGTYYIKNWAFYSQYKTGLYFISVNRILPPAVATISINNANPSTNRREVLLSNTATNLPLEYMASESPTFAGAAWQPYSLGPIFSIESKANGTKPIYFKLRNEAGSSAVASDTILLKKIPINVLVAYKSDSAWANDLAAWLLGRGLIPKVVQMNSILTIPQATLKTYQVLLMGPDTGSASNWGTSALVSYIQQSGQPVLGMGDGGYAFFGKPAPAIGYPKGGSSNVPNAVVVDGSHTVYNLPNTLGVFTGLTGPVYANPTPMVAINLPTIPAGVVPLARQEGQTTYYTVLYQTPHYMLWGYNGPPSAMTDIGQNVFENVVRFTAGMVVW